MIEQFITIGLLMLLTAMLPGPDLALVTKNTVLYSRQSGVYTAFGIGCALSIHITLCALGLAVLIVNSPFIFSIIKYIGACYLIYTGVNSWRIKHPEKSVISESLVEKNPVSHAKAFTQGFLCNLLNPKAILFLMSLFTLVIKPATPSGWIMIYALEMVLITFLWFYYVTIILSHPRLTSLLKKSEGYIAKLSGTLLIFCGISLFFIKSLT